MLDLGPHAAFIIAAYAVTFVALGALTLFTIGDDRKERRMLVELERKGIRRRSASKPQAATRAAKSKRTAPKAAVSKAGNARKTPAAKRKTPRPRTRKDQS